MTAIGGVPAGVLADRMACLKGGVVANVVVPTPDYVRVASHYGCAPDFCHAADPQSKGIVENLCGYAQRALAVPLLTEAALAGTEVDVRAANTAAAAWCAEVNALVHSEICAVPEERLAIERELGPLPSLRLQIGAPSALRKVDRLSCIRYTSARYSLPTRLIDTSVTVVLDHGAVCIVEPTTGVMVAEHELAAPGTASIDDAHYDGPRPAPNRAHARKPRPSSGSAHSDRTRSVPGRGSPTRSPGGCCRSQRRTRAVFSATRGSVRGDVFGLALSAALADHFQLDGSEAAELQARSTDTASS